MSESMSQWSKIYADGLMQKKRYTSALAMGQRL